MRLFPRKLVTKRSLLTKRGREARTRGEGYAGTSRSSSHSEKHEASSRIAGPGRDLMGPLMNQKLPCNLSGSKSAFGGEGGKLMILQLLIYINSTKYAFVLNYPYSHSVSVSVSLSLSLSVSGGRWRTMSDNQ